MNSIFDPLRSGRLVGFDNLFRNLDRFWDTAMERVSWPPYDIVKVTDNEYNLQLALAGFRPEDINVLQEGDKLIIHSNESDTNKSEDGPTYLHKGIAQRNFYVEFMLAERTEILDVTMNNGILQIEMKKVQEEPKSVEFKINSSDKALMDRTGQEDTLDDVYPGSDMVQEAKEAEKAAVA